MLSSSKKVGVAFLGHRPLKSRLRAQSSNNSPVREDVAVAPRQPGRGCRGLLLGDCAAGA